jgi:hypothetical protein
MYMPFGFLAHKDIKIIWLSNIFYSVPDEGYSRNQQIKRKQLTYYLDGAHTVESIEVKNLFTSDNFRFGNNI